MIRRPAVDQPRRLRYRAAHQPEQPAEQPPDPDEQHRPLMESIARYARFRKENPKRRPRRQAAEPVADQPQDLDEPVTAEQLDALAAAPAFDQAVAQAQERQANPEAEANAGSSPPGPPAEQVIPAEINGVELQGARPRKSGRRPWDINLGGNQHTWKVQYLDLSGVQRGVVRREERFGYLQLAAIGFKSPCLTAEVDGQRKSNPPPFISGSKWGSVARVTFAVEMLFGLESGKPEEWQRLKIANLE